MAATAWWAAWGAVLALAVWLDRLNWPWVLLAAAGTLAWTVWQARARTLRTAGWLAAVVLWLAAGTAAGLQVQLHAVAREWPRVRDRVEDRAAAALQTALDDVVDRGEAAVRGAAEIAARHGRRSARPFARLEQVRSEAGVQALAVFGPNGAPLIWAGEHRGMIPGAVRLGQRSYVFQEGPLFSYVYFVRPVGGGRTVVAAVLLEANVGVEHDNAAFAQLFAARHTVVPRFSTPEQAPPEAVWDWSTDRPILSVSFARLTPEAWRQRLVRRAQSGIGGLWAAAFLLLALAWYRGRAQSPGVPVVVAAASLTVMPLGSILGTEALFSPLRFLLPGPGDTTLGELAVLLAGLALWLLARDWGRETPRWRPHPVLALALAAAILPLAPALIRGGAAPLALAVAPGGGLALHLVAMLLLTVPLAVLLRSTRGKAPPLPAATLWLVVLLSVAPGLAMVLVWNPGSAPSPLPALVWIVPFALLLWTRRPTWFARQDLFAWLAAGWLAGTLILPFVWTLHTQARVEEAERELARLGTETDPYLDYLLRQFADVVTAGAAAGENGVNLLYRNWVGSGLAAEGYEARVALWERGRVDAELRLSEAQLPPEMVARVGERSRGAAPRLERFTDSEAVHYLLSVPLPDRRTVTVMVPPRRSLGRATPLARLIQSNRDREAVSDFASLSLVPAGTAEPLPTGAPRRLSGRVQWVRTDAGWRSETLVNYPSGVMHAHLRIPRPPLPLLAMRGLLLQALLFALVAALWAGGRALRGKRPGTTARPRRWTRSFRGRLTLALFVFFLLPTVLLGFVAYGAVSREVVRTAAALASRALEQAGERAETESLGRAGTRVGSDLLLYENGLLVDAASREMLDLGLFHAWLPPAVFLLFADGADDRALEERRLGGSRYLVAYRRHVPGEVLAAPIPLASGEIARRQEEFAYAALFMSLVGAALSVMLALLVGRALTRPIDRLSRATTLVGSGDLRLHLPEEQPDEFGTVYRAFNRMVRQLSSTRAALLRETTRTEAVVAEAATGILALDAAGRVALANARAQQILGAPLTVGDVLPASRAVPAEIARALHEFRATRAADWGTDLEVDARNLRLRFRRLPAEGGASGTVVALEDITDDLRSARILAWGEMARQVAHEIKNPLTPIKLSVQHLRRAYADGRPDFGTILDRNVGAILAEIDRLGDIARAFARFGAPAPATGELQAVDLREVVEETLTLYRGGGGDIRYDVAIPATLPRVLTHAAELKEVLVNLLENAREALPYEGTITLSAVAAGGGSWVQLDVRDTGVGIAPEAIPRIFEPQFSTRTSGTGLGLAIVRRLVEGWGGEITADSEVGIGTTVHLRLAAG